MPNSHIIKRKVLFSDHLCTCYKTKKNSNNIVMILNNMLYYIPFAYSLKCVLLRIISSVIMNVHMVFI